jgi:hypothetical protein
MSVARRRVVSLEFSELVTKNAIFVASTVLAKKNEDFIILQILGRSHVDY